MYLFDIKLQKKVDNIIEEQLIRAKSEANTKYLNKTYVIIQKPYTGEILAMSGRKLYKEGNSYRSYDITPYALTDPMAPGSVVKGASMLVGYNTKSIQVGEIMTDECIKIKGTNEKCSSHILGRIDDITALAKSSNVYQFKTAIRVSGYEYKRGFGIL